ncbi:MAG: hypothetical protein ACXU82_05215 [Caulobacteraceae bacterium]
MDAGPSETAGEGLAYHAAPLKMAQRSGGIAANLLLHPLSSSRTQRSQSAEIRDPAEKTFDVGDAQLRARNCWLLGSASLRSLAEDDEL